MNTLFYNKVINNLLKMENSKSNMETLFENAMTLSNKELKELCAKNNIDTNSALEKHEYANLLAEKQIKINIKKKFEQNECSICYESLGEKNNCITPCGHVFCFECMMKALNRNNSCPCCRAPLREEPEESDDETDDEEEDEFEWNPIEENINHWRHETTFYNMTANDGYATPKTIAKKIEDAGYNMEDLVTIWLERIDRASTRYRDNNFVKKMVSDIENLVDKEDEDKYQRENELELMREEDSRRYTLETNNIFDMDIDLNLDLLFNYN